MEDANGDSMLSMTEDDDDDDCCSIIGELFMDGCLLKNAIVPQSAASVRATAAALDFEVGFAMVGVCIQRGRMER